jgi:chaperonin cofactor prefoldin
MDFNLFSDWLLDRLVTDLELNAIEVYSAIERLKNARTIIAKAFAELKEHIIAEPFQQEQDEIHCFRYTYTVIQARGIYEREVFLIGNAKPLYGLSLITLFYEDKLKSLQSWLDQHWFYVQYEHTGATELDHLFFVRGAKLPEAWIQEVLPDDPEFSTPIAILLSQVKAYEMLASEIQHRLKELSLSENDAPLLRDSPNGERLKWTGQMVDLVELAYALQTNGCINNGRASIVDIVSFLSKGMQVPVNNPSRKFDEIKARKLLSGTHFMDQLRDGLKKRIEDSFAFHQGLRRARRISPKN